MLLQEDVDVIHRLKIWEGVEGEARAWARALVRPPSASLYIPTVSALPGVAPAVETKGLGRRFGERWAVADVDLTLAAGECLAIFGPNGAGKTTLLRLLGGLLDPSAGTARVDGMPLPGDEHLRARVGFISHHTMLYPALTARENVEFAARLQGLRAPRAAASAALTRLRVLDRADTPVRSLSRGLQQRVSIARAFVHSPRIVLLDEPYTGLDAVGAAALSTALEDLKAAGAALMLVTHHLEEGLALANTVAVMRNGRFVGVERRDAIDVTAYTAYYRTLLRAGE
jgi:heme exporter protein A